MIANKLPLNLLNKNKEDPTTKWHLSVPDYKDVDTKKGSSAAKSIPH